MNSFFMSLSNEAEEVSPDQTIFQHTDPWLDSNTHPSSTGQQVNSDLLVLKSFSSRLFFSRSRRRSVRIAVIIFSKSTRTFKETFLVSFPDLKVLAPFPRVRGS